MTDRTFCLDARTVHPHFPGVGRYAASLAHALPAVLEPSERLVVLRDQTAPAAWVHGDTGSGRVQVVDVAVSPFSLRQQWVIPPLLRRLDVGLYHSPYYLMPVRPGVPTVVTLHDLIPLRYPQLFTTTQRLIYRVATRLALRASRVVISVSAATAQDVEALLGLSAERVVVIPEAADPSFRPQPDAVVAALRQRLSLPQEYVLYVGSNKPHKNLVRLVEAWARLRPAGTVLVIAGAWDARFPQARQRAVALGVTEHVHFIGPVADADLAALYSGALLFVFPSECEGFGLPVLEAMACGVPIACSNVSSLTEVAGEVAVRFAPHDVDAIAAAIASLLRDADRRTDLSRRGVERAAQFSWDAAARATLAVYRNATALPAQR